MGSELKQFRASVIYYRNLVSVRRSVSRWVTKLSSATMTDCRLQIPPPHLNTAHCVEYSFSVFTISLNLSQHSQLTDQWPKINCSSCFWWTLKFHSSAFREYTRVNCWRKRPVVSTSQLLPPVSKHLNVLYRTGYEVFCVVCYHNYHLSATVIYFLLLLRLFYPQISANAFIRDLNSTQMETVRLVHLGRGGIILRSAQLSGKARKVTRCQHSSPALWKEMHETST